MAHISDQVPEHWAKVLKPYLLRAKEFEAREPPVAYFLKTYVANEAMKLRKKDDSAGSKFLMTLLDHLEAERGRLGADVNTADGRTVLTKAALMLFSKADDLERVGQSNQGIVKLFFASSQLFEATTQFTKEGKMDPIAQEKSKYAKYIAFRMKKALDTGAPYVSPNELETPDTQDPPTLPANDPMTLGQPPAVAPPQQQQTPPPVGFPQIPTNNNNSIDSNPYQPQPPRDHYQGAPTVPAPASNPAYQQQPIPAPAPAPYVQQPAPPVPVVAQPAPAMATTTVAPPAPAPAPTGGPEPDMDKMMKAQKFAKQAVAALQFFDHQNAREQLVAAIQTLDGQK